MDTVLLTIVIIGSLFAVVGSIFSIVFAWLNYKRSQLIATVQYNQVEDILMGVFERIDITTTEQREFNEEKAKEDSVLRYKMYWLISVRTIIPLLLTHYKEYMNQYSSHNMLSSKISQQIRKLEASEDGLLKDAITKEISLNKEKLDEENIKLEASKILLYQNIKELMVYFSYNNSDEDKIKDTNNQKYNENILFNTNSNAGKHREFYILLNGILNQTEQRYKDIVLFEKAYSIYFELEWEKIQANK